VTLNADGTCQTAGIGLTNVGPTPIQATEAEAFLRGKKLDDAAIRQAGKLAADAAQPSSDLRGTAEFKKGLVEEFTRRGLRKATERAQGGN